MTKAEKLIISARKKLFKILVRPTLLGDDFKDLLLVYYALRNYNEPKKGKK